MRKEIFTISAMNLTIEEGIDLLPYTGEIYFSEEECVKAARKAAKECVSWVDVIEFSVMAGEYQNESGDVFGDPFVIFTISSSDKWTTKDLREKLGYCSLFVNEYAA